MAKAKSGGGITGNKVVQSKGVKAGAPAKGIAPRGTIGLQRITTTGYSNRVANPNSVTLGNELAPKVGIGPGAGRTVHRSGSQQSGPRPSASTAPGGWPWSDK